MYLHDHRGSDDQLSSFEAEESFIEFSIRGNEKLSTSITGIILNCLTDLRQDVRLIDVSQLTSSPVAHLVITFGLRELKAREKVLEQVLNTCSSQQWDVDYKLFPRTEESFDTHGLSTDDSIKTVPVVAHILQSGSQIKADILNDAARILMDHRMKVDSIFTESNGDNETEQFQSLEFHGALTLDETAPASLFQLNAVRECAGALETACRAHDAEAVMRQDIMLNRSNTLVVMGLNESILEEELVDVLSRAAGVALTPRPGLVCPGKLRDKIRALANQPVSIIEECMRQTRLTTGAFVTCEALRMCGCKTALVTQGFAWAADVVGKQFGFTHVLCN
eukprot:Selendium_serpulae@DN658_c0_g1_i1.p1